MKRKLLSLLLCTAMLISALPVTSLADGTATSAGAKLGVANGDIVRFAGKDRHPIFVEPCGENTEEMYLQGASSSLPEDVQNAFYHTVCFCSARAPMMLHRQQHRWTGRTMPATAFIAHTSATYIKMRL